MSGTFTRGPAPEGFAELAATNPVGFLRAHYDAGEVVITRWLREMPDDWQAERMTLMHRRKLWNGAERAASHEERKAKRAAWYRAKRAAEAQVAKARPPQDKPLPDGFFENAMTMTCVELAALYAVSSSTASRMVDKLSPEQREAVRVVGAERRRAASRSNAIKLERANRAAARAQKLADRAKPVKAKRSMPTRNFGFGRPTTPADLPGGLAQRAVDHLKRHYAPAFNAERVYGKDWAGFFVVGRDKLDKDGVVNLARRHGFNADAWRELAA